MFCFIKKITLQSQGKESENIEQNSHEKKKLKMASYNLEANFKSLIIIQKYKARSFFAFVYDLLNLLKLNSFIRLLSYKNCWQNSEKNEVLSFGVFFIFVKQHWFFWFDIKFAWKNMKEIYSIRIDAFVLLRFNLIR